MNRRRPNRERGRAETGALADAEVPVVTPLYRLRSGTAYVGDSLLGMRKHLRDESVSLFMTSPPFALSSAKEYGNKAESAYVEWFRDFALVMWDKLQADGSLVLDLGGAYQRGRPVRSLYQFKLLIELCEGLGDRNFHLAQEFFWFNPAKMPLPAQWVNVDRVRVKDSVNVIWWLSKTEHPKADNRKVLTPYSRDMELLLERQTYNGGRRPGGAVVNPETWKRRHQGAIPSNTFQFAFDEERADTEPSWANFLSVGGSESASRYHRAFAALEKAHAEDLPGLRQRARKHPARFPHQIPEFFVRLLTEPGDLVADPFAGSNVTGKVASSLRRKWASFELHRFYLEPSIARFDEYFTGDIEWLDDHQKPLLDALSVADLAT